MASRAPRMFRNGHRVWAPRVREPWSTGAVGEYSVGWGTSVSVGVGVAYPGVGMGVAYPAGYWPGTPVGGVWVGGPVY